MAFETPPAVAAALKRLPAGPGVYLFRDAAGELLYIGKAKSLRAFAYGPK